MLVIADKLSNSIERVNVVWLFEIVSTHLAKLVEYVTVGWNLGLGLEVVADFLLAEDSREDFPNSIIILVISRLDNTDVELVCRCHRVFEDDLCWALLVC